MASGELYRVGPFVAVAGLLALVSGCGKFRVFEEREPWRAEAERQCLASGALQASWAMERVSPISGPGVCGMDYPIRVMAFAGGAVSLRQKNMLGCPMVAGVDRWMAQVVQPAAQAAYGAPVIEIRSGSYSCRPRNNQRGARLSEHAFGNAVDVFSFRFADGREVAVKSGWRGPPDEQQFLKTVFAGACGQFATVLGPGSDSFHSDHMHLDLARHDPRGMRHVCRPLVRPETLPGEGRLDRPMLSYRPPAAAPGEAVAAAPLPLPRAAAAAKPFPPSAYAPAPVRLPPGSIPSAPRPAYAASARPGGTPIDLAAPARPAAPYAAGAAPASAPPEAGEIDPEHDPYAVDD